MPHCTSWLEPASRRCLSQRPRGLHLSMIRVPEASGQSPLPASPAAPRQGTLELAHTTAIHISNEIAAPKTMTGRISARGSRSSGAPVKWGTDARSQEWQVASHGRTRVAVLPPPYFCHSPLLHQPPLPSFGLEPTLPQQKCNADTGGMSNDSAGIATSSRRQASCADCVPVRTFMPRRD